MAGQVTPFELWAASERARLAALNKCADVQDGIRVEVCVDGGKVSARPLGMDKVRMAVNDERNLSVISVSLRDASLFAHGLLRMLGEESPDAPQA